MRRVWLITLAYLVNTALINTALINTAWVNAAATEAQQKLTYVDLCKRLTDLERLAVLPEVGEQCAQWSSYDRKSRYDEKTGKYVEWDANGDGWHGKYKWTAVEYIRKEGDQFVLAEMTGPGCLWRIWSAGPKEGHLRIFLDGAEVPAVDMPFEDYFNGKNEPFTFPSLVHHAAWGRNCYVPIPYQKSCKIVGEEGYGVFYEFGYSTFPEGTQVPTFTRNLSDEERSALASADKILRRGGIDPAGKRPMQRDLEIIRKMFGISAGQTTRVLDLAGPRAITGIRFKLDLPGVLEQARQVLRELALSIQWDGEENPSVWAPVGDFFGTAPGANLYQSLPLGLTEDGWWYCNWYMPFARKALVELTNDGRASRNVTFEITHAPLSKPIEQLGRFHAKWHRDAFLPKEPERQIDWTMLKMTGRGRFCGVMLHVWNPTIGWWGEGDEKFFVDGEKFPSTFGTGSEDYFGYAWCCPLLFQNAFHNQTLCENKNVGHISVNRWHITDNVPFQKSFEGCIEKYFSNDRPTLYACTVYWYQAPGGNDPYRPTDVGERVSYCLSDVKAPVVSETLFVEPDKIILTTETKGAEIRYTLDGTEPTTDSPRYAAPLALKETTTIRARAFKANHYPSSLSTMVVTKTTYREPDKPGPLVNGLQYSYYEGKWNQTSEFAKAKPVKTGNTATFELTPANREDEFGFRFTGYIDVPRDGIYTFYAKADDGTVLYVGDRELVKNDRPNGRRERAGSIALKAGKHPIAVTFIEKGGDQYLDIQYRGPGIEKQPIPADVLFRR